MIRRLLSTLLLLAFMMLAALPVAAYAGGSGGEPLISDAVGWGLVGAMVIIGIYAVHEMKKHQPASNEKLKDNSKSYTWNQLHPKEFIKSNGDIIIIKF